MKRETQWFFDKTRTGKWSPYRPYGITLMSWVLSVALAYVTGAPAVSLLLGVVVGCLFATGYSSTVSVLLSIGTFCVLLQHSNWQVEGANTPRIMTFAFAAAFICYVICTRERRNRKISRELRELIDLLPHQIFLFDPKARLLTANKAVADFTGKALEELITCDIEALLHLDNGPGSSPGLSDAERRNLEKGCPFEAEFRALGKSGNHRWFLFRYMPWCDSNGAVSQWICTATDIDQTKKADEQLCLVVDTTPAFIHSANPDGKIDYLNQRWLNYTGLSLDAAITGKSQIRDKNDVETEAPNLVQTVHPDDLDFFVKRWNAIIAEGEESSFEARIRRYDGQFRWFLFQSAPLYDASSKVVKWYVASIDIDDRKRAEEELRNKDIEVVNQLRLAIDTPPFLAWTARPDGSVEFLNRRWLEYSGLSLDEAMDWKFLVVIHPDDIPPGMELYEAALKDGTLFEAELRMRRFDGEYRRFLVRGSPFRDASGNIVRWFGANTDIEDLKRAEEALRASEQSLRLVVDTIPGLVHTVSPSGELENVSKQEIEYFGKQLEELKNWESFVHPDDLEDVVNEWTRQREAGEPYETEIRMLRCDGMYRWVHVQGVPLRSHTGDIVRWYFLMSDVDERHRFAEENRLRERYFAEGQRLSRTASFSWQVTDKDALYLSEEGFRIYGFELNKALPLWEERLQWIHPEDRPRWLQVRDRAVEEKADYEVQYRILHPSGEVKWLRIVGHAVLGSNDDLVEYVGTVIDMTEQHKAEEAIRETERRLRLIVETIPALIWSVNPNGDSFFASQQFLTYAGCSLEDLNPPNWLRFIHPDDVAETLSWLITLRDGCRHETTHRLRRSDGIYRWFRAIAEPLQDKNGEMSHWFGLNIDIEDNRNMAETLRATQSRLSRATQIATVAELSASIAHEINQPLGAIVANAEAGEMWLTADTPNLERARTAIQRIVRDGNAAAEVIQRIRALFRQSLPNKSSLNMNEVITEVLDLVSDESRKRRVVVKTDLAGNLPSIMADRVQMQQLISNLVNNAIESMDAVPDSRKSLLVRSRLNSEGSVLIEVHDRGVGFDQTDRIFDAFFTTKEKGMGMGLSIAKNIVEAHNGQLSARPNDGDGTVFTLALPLVSSCQTPVSQATP